MKKAIVILVVVALVTSLVTLGTIAWLQDTDSDINVMTMGNVYIEQLEYERVVEDGAWVSTGNVDKYGYTPDKVQEFTQHKPLLPANFADGQIKWDDRVNGTHQQSWAEVGAPGSNQLFDDSVKNVQDKFVFVKNTGTTSAYVRTWFAFELGNVAFENWNDIVMLNVNKNHWSWEWAPEAVTISGNQYVIACATYKGPSSNPTGILAPGATTYASLLQVYMKPTATNEDVTAIDGNDNGLYEILVCSQAVQADGFENSDHGLDLAFGEEHPWINGIVIPYMITTEEELIQGGNLTVGKSFELDNPAGTVIDKDTYLNLNGKTISATRLATGNNTAEAISAIVVRGANLTIVGDGSVSDKSTIANDQTDGGYTIAIYDGATVTVKGGHFYAAHDVFYVRKGTLIIEGGFFDAALDTNPNTETDYSPHTKNYEECHRSTVINCFDDDYVEDKCIVIITGGTFVNMDPSNVHEGRLHHQNFVADGYKVVAEPQANGDVWYTVVPA